MAAPISVFLIDPPERLDPPTDTSLAIMRESLKRGHEVHYCTPSDLQARGPKLWADLRPVSFYADRELFAAGPRRSFDLNEADLLYLRKDPPVDTAFLHLTYLLDQLEASVVQINPASTLRDHCEKLLPLHFPELFPQTLVTSSADALENFLDQVEHMVIKPLEDCSGRGIYALTLGDVNRHNLLHLATAGGTRFVQAQRYLPEISRGDKRVLLLGGKVLGWVRRLPAPGDFRSNVNAGGHCEPCDLTENDRVICRRIAPWLLDRGIHLAGIDIVGRFVLEINITSPSCLREINQLTGEHLEEQIVDYAEGLLERR